MDAAALIARLEEQRRQWVARLEEQRRQWVELEPGGPRVRFKRPAETEFGQFRTGVLVEHVCQYVDGWERMTEAHVLGARQGSADAAVPFSAELWAALVQDRIDWVAAVARGIADAISAHLQAKEAASGN